MARQLNILYLVKDSPFDPRGHAAQRFRSLILEWSAQDNVDVKFFYPGPNSQTQKLGRFQGFEVQSKRTVLEKLRGIFLPYHFRLVGQNFVSQVRQQIAGEKFDVIVAEELTMAELGLQLSKLINTPLYYVAHNFESYLFKQISRPLRDLFQRQVLKLKERAIVRDAKSVLAFSSNDSSRLSTTFGRKTVETTTAGFDLKSVTFSNSRHNKKNILIVGAMDYLPNVESVIWFATEIYPKIKTQCTVTVAGRNPTPEVKSQCAKSGFTLVASPVNMDPVLQQGQIEVVPLLKGSGTRGKILEAMAAGLPIVSTSLGCEGLDLRHGKHLLVADNPLEFASAVDSLLTNPDLQNELATAALEKVQEFSYRAVARKLTDDLIKDL